MPSSSPSLRARLAQSPWKWGAGVWSSLQRMTAFAWRSARLIHSVKARIIAGVALTTLLGLGSILAAFWGAAQVDRALDEISDVAAPAEDAAHEMELNANGVGLLTLGYVNSANESLLGPLQGDLSDFQAFLYRYAALAADEQERVLAQRMSVAFTEFKTLSSHLVRARDRLERGHDRVSALLASLDSVIEEIASPLTPSGTQNPAFAAVALSAEAEAAEMGYWLVEYEHLLREDARGKLVGKISNVTKLLQRLQQLAPAHTRPQLFVDLRAIEEELKRQIEAQIADAAQMSLDIERFLSSRVKIDRLLDDEIQPRLAKRVLEPRQRAEAASRRALGSTSTLALLFMIGTLVAGITLLRSITRPLGVLRQATEAVAAGDLERRVRVRRRDEFGDLAAAFNRMVVKLQATTVSRNLLEESEEKLRHNVIALEDEIGQRARLEESLRRSEKLTSMGALVAGVAHEVRNPLFGMSSTLDAMSARFGGQPGIERYAEVLKREMARLNALMVDLLDYGKPITKKSRGTTVEAIIDNAAASQSALAHRSGVTLVCEVEAGLPELALDAARMHQVFGNLIENAIQHSPAGGQVRVTARLLDAGSASAAIECVVCDQGPGFAANDVALLFDPFFTRRRGGTGMGLAIVQRVVEDHGGAVSAANAPGGGGQMVVRLPLQPMAEHENVDFAVI